VRTTSYLQDTTDLLNTILQLDVLPNDCFLVTADVSSLYTSIPHKDGITACRIALNTRQYPDPPTQILVEFINIILSKNNFMFNNQHYLQIQGTAMGTKMAPSYANLFMAQFEETFMATRQHLPLVYKRYIDDILMIWTHGEDELKAFMTAMNSHHPTIKLTHEWSTEEINFLDVTVYIKNNTVGTKLYTKPTDTHQYLQFTSSHPLHNKKAIPFSQALRLKRINSEPADFEHSVTNLAFYLKKRGYPRNLIQQGITRARNMDRLTLLSPQTKPIDPIHRIPCIITYNPSMPTISDSLKEHWPILLAERNSAFKSKKAIIAYKRPPNLRDHLVRALFCPEKTTQEETNNGSTKCPKKCITCKYMKITKTFESMQNHQTYNIGCTIDCQTENVVYLIECRKCPLQYVGETKNSINYHLIRHRASHKARKEEPVAEHFNSHEHTINDLTITGIEKIINKRDSTRSKRESFWIDTLDTLTPRGLNIRD
jgi:hypothetical protein